MGYNMFMGSRGTEQVCRRYKAFAKVDAEFVSNIMADAAKFDGLCYANGLYPRLLGIFEELGDTIFPLLHPNLARG